MVEETVNQHKGKVAEHAVTKTKNAEYARLTQELEAIEKNNSMLKLIELQYKREIDRRHKKEEKDKLEKKLGEKIIDSPLRRAREYACSIAGSPSPCRHELKKGCNCSKHNAARKGSFEFSISPSKAPTEETKNEQLKKFNPPKRTTTFTSNNGITI